MSEEKIKGKVKWYSIRKGFGFITPSSDNAPTEEDIFFHQTSIVSDVKNKWLESDYEVEFEVYTDEAGKYKSKNVTQPGGAPCEIPKRTNTRRRGKGGKGADGATDDEGAKTDDDGEKKDEKKEGETNKEKGRNNRNNNRGKGKAAEKKEGENGDTGAPSGGRRGRKRFDDDISLEVKNKMKEKKLDMRQTSLLVVLEKNRIKFGPDGYAALCHADGFMAEGTFACDDEGKVTFTWKNMLKFSDGEWKPEDPIANTSSGVLVESFNWTDDNVEGLKTIITPESLWGDDKTDPADALQSNNFQMKKCFLSKTPGNPRNRRRPRPRGKKSGGGKANGKAENGKEAENGTKVAPENGKKENGTKEAEKAES